jgi:hypothetical protein
VNARRPACPNAQLPGGAVALSLIRIAPSARTRRSRCRSRRASIPRRPGPTGGPELEYPLHDWTAVVTTCGRTCYQRRTINVSQIFAGQKAGVQQTGDHVWLVTFMDDDLGTSMTIRAGSNRWMIPSVRDCYPCLQNEVLPMSPE